MSAPISNPLSSTAPPYDAASDPNVAHDVAHDIAANTRLVQQAIAHFQRGDIPALLDTMTDDIEWSVPVVEHATFSGPRQGRAAVERFFADLAVNQTPRRFEPRQYVAQGDEVVVLGHYAWHVLPTGREWEAEYAHVFTIRDGRIARFREYMDTGRAAAAFRPEA